MDVLRPTNLNEYIGQERLKRRLMVMIMASLNTSQPLRHILLCASPGAGKTSLANLIAELVGDEFYSMNMPIREDALVQALTEHQGRVLFLDEVHAIGTKLQELLLPVLEFGQVHLLNGDILPVGFLTIIAATTERQMVLPALYRRFSFKPQYERYKKEELRAVAASMAKKKGLDLPPSVLDAIGEAAGGKPHCVKDMIEAAADITAVYEGPPDIEEILDQCGLTADGLTESHVEYLLALKKLKGSAGQDRIGAMIGHKASICTELEQLLIDQELIAFGGKGRELTPAGRRRVQQLLVAA